MDGQVFTVKNSDIFVMYKKTIHPHVETAVQQIRYLFDDDPLIVEEEHSDKKFASWYDAEQDFDSVLQTVQGMAHAEQKRQIEVRGRMDARAALKARQEQGEPLTPRVLARIETALSKADLSNLVRRQFICRVDSNMVPEQIFSELFISIKDLRETMIPDVNLVANRWLFQYLTETLDKRMLAVLANRDIGGMASPVSLNLNVNTILSRDFQNFHKAIGKSASRVVVEMQVLDIFADMNTYGYARDSLQERGYRVLVDGLSPLALQFFDPGLLQSDFVKIAWGPEFDGDTDSTRLAEMREVVASTGKDSVILARIDTEEAVKWGLAMGISRFQGFFIDDIMKKLAEVQAEKARAKSKSRPKPQAQPAVLAPPVEQPAPAQPAAQPAPVPTQPQPAPVPVQPAQQPVPAPAQPQPKPAPKV